MRKEARVLHFEIVVLHLAKALNFFTAEELHDFSGLRLREPLHIMGILRGNVVQLLAHLVVENEARLHKIVVGSLDDCHVHELWFGFECCSTLQRKWGSYMLELFE